MSPPATPLWVSVTSSPTWVPAPEMVPLYHTSYSYYTDHMHVIHTHTQGLLCSAVSHLSQCGMFKDDRKERPAGTTKAWKGPRPRQQELQRGGESEPGSQGAWPTWSSCGSWAGSTCVAAVPVTALLNPPCCSQHTGVAGSTDLGCCILHVDFSLGQLWANITACHTR